MAGLDDEIPDDHPALTQGVQAPPRPATGTLDDELPDDHPTASMTATPTSQPGPLHQFGEIGRDIRKDAGAGIDTWKRGIQGIMHPDPTIHERLGSLADLPLGLVEIAGSPATGAARAIAGDPLRGAARWAGVPEGGANFIGNLGEQTAGLVGPGIFGKAANEAAPVVSKLVQRRPEMAQRVEDFDRAGITPNLPAISQNRTVGNAANVVREVPLLGETVSGGIQKNIGEAKESTENVASQFAPGTDSRAAAGESLRKGKAQFTYGPTGEPNPPSIESAADVTKPTRQVGFIPKSEALYDRIPIDAGSNAQVSGTVETLNNLRTQFPSNPELNRLLSNPAFERMFQAIRPGFEEVAGAPSIRGTTELRREPNANDFLAWQKNGFSVEPTTTLQPSGGLSWQDLKNLRSLAGRKMRDPSDQLGLGPDAWKALYGATSRDMEATAAANGPDAVKAFNRATDYYRTGLARLNDAMGYIDKAGSDEKAFDALLGKATENGRPADLQRFTATVKSMPDEFRDDIAATVIRRLGKPTDSQAGANAANFSLGSWGTRYAGINNTAKEALFGPVGTSRRDDLEALSRSITALKNVERLGNPSGSGRLGIAFGSSAMTAGMLTRPLETLATAGGTYAGARLLMSPGFARWLANSMKVQTEGGWSAQMARLNSLAQKYPETVGPYAAAVTATAHQGATDQ